MPKHILRAFLGLLLVSIVLSLGFVSLYRNEARLLEKVAPTRTVTGGQSLNTLVLNGSTSAEELSRFFLEKGIYRDPRDADGIARWITSRITKNVENLGALNKTHFRMPTDTLFGQPFLAVAGESMRLALETSQGALGITPGIRALYDSLSRTGTLPTSATGLIVPLGAAQEQDSLLLSQSGAKHVTVSIEVRKTKQAYDTLSVNSPGFKFHALTSIPYIGRRVADKILQRQKQAEKNQEGVPGILVRVRDHSADPDGLDCGYLLTDAEGKTSIRLPQGGYYSFLPISVGHEYGASKGTRRGPLTEDTQYSFIQKRHTIRPIDSRTYLRIKEDVLLSVRSPQEYKNSILLYPFLFLLAWWLFFVFMAGYDLKKRARTDYVIPLALMTLSGVGLLAMFSVVHPLTDTFLGSSMATGAAVGVAAMAWLSSRDWGYFYNAGVKTRGTSIQFDFVLQLIRWIKLPFMDKIRGMKLSGGSGGLKLIGYYCKLALAILLIPLEILIRLLEALLIYLDKLIKKLALAINRNPDERTKMWSRQPLNLQAPKGTGYLVIVLLLILLLQLFGDGPEGSGTKVNLFFFQPSELNKYLVVFFMAAFFAVRADRIHTFSQVADSLHLRLQLKSVIGILVAIGLLLVLYMVVMSDMGPALVLIVTFIFLYSIARKDFPQLLIGIVTFLAMVWFGGYINDGAVSTKFIFAVLWLGIWIAFWYLKDKRLYESAIFFNFLLSAFIFLGTFLAGSNIDALRSVGQRIIDRNDVALNLWDNAVTGGGDQVVQGIWGLASGGLFGQGLGKGNPNLVPAFHTDMIFTSIGEEMGWIALVLIILCLAVLIHRSLINAYNSGDRFLFFLSSGIALVTGVQFFVIIFGAIGVIPLTGVAVPFLSFGMTSLIINLAVFGIVLSVSRIEATKSQREINRPYRYVTAVGIGSFLAVSLILVAILFQYQVLPSTRNKYLVKPAFVANTEGYRLTEFNPRIKLLLKEMRAGNILDRNGLLLATSDRDRYTEFEQSLQEDERLGAVLQDHLSRERFRVHSRYYPFGDNLFFMLGDCNTQTLWGISETNPYGFFAEDRLLGELRGFTTLAKDKDGKPIEIRKDGHIKRSPFAAPADSVFKYNKRDYSPLVPYLKDGIHGRKVARYNKQTDKGTRDIYLTVDARLQTILQSNMQQRLTSPNCNYGSTKRPKLRASVVVLNAESGDVITSASYPLPSQDTIRKYQNLKLDYSKYERTWTNPVYTDRDLGATYQSNPGSTAKIMTSIAGFMKEGVALDRVAYDVHSDVNDNRDERIHTGRNGEPSGRVTLWRAIVESSNCYFINLVNDKDLFPQLETVYNLVGARVVKPTYYLFQDEVSDQTRHEREADLHREVTQMQGHSVAAYHSYRAQRARGNFKKMRNQYWQWPWGQGTLDASPLTMARVASIAYNGGVLPETHWIYASGQPGHLDYYHPSETRVIDAQSATILRQHMRDQARRGRRVFPSSLGGKTGTPGRNIKFDVSKDAYQVNDGWYICFVDTQAPESSPLAIAVRLERVGINNTRELGGGSGLAMDFVLDVVLPSLRESGYIIE